MQFVYHVQAGEKQTEITGDSYQHLFKSRRQKSQNHLYLRNLKDDMLYTYHVDHISKKQANISLLSQKQYPIKSTRSLHFGWCMVDPKTEKTLPLLNELGVSHISFIYAQRSQKSYKLNMQRIEKILISSCEQCGRSDLMQIDIHDSLKDFLSIYPQSTMINFSSTLIDINEHINTYIIGAEGGFSDDEIALFDTEHIRGLHTKTILKSETALLSIAAKNIY